MAWPANANNISTTNLDAGTDNPASARPDLKAALDEINSSSSTNLTIDPTTGVVVVEDVVQLNPVAYAALPSSPAKGQTAFLITDGAGSTKNKPIYHNGSSWRYTNDDSAVATS